MKLLRHFLTESISQLAAVKVDVRDVSRDWSHPEARYFNNRIELYDKFFDHDPSVQIHMLCHEAGHWFRDKFVDLSDVMGWEDGDKFYNLFSAGNSEEGFAEAFAVYCTSPHELHRRYPTQFAFIKAKVSASDAAYVKRWAESTLNSVLK